MLDSNQRMAELQSAPLDLLGNRAKLVAISGIEPEPGGYESPARPSSYTAMVATTGFEPVISRMRAE